MTLLTLTTPLLANGNHWHHFWLWPLIPLAWLFVIFVAFRFFWGPRYWPNLRFASWPRATPETRSRWTSTGREWRR